MQASDRRFTYVDGEEHIDESNKAIFVAERLTFAFTGRANIAGEPTDSWFQQQVSRHLGQGMALQEVFAEVAEMLTQYFKSLPDSDRNRALALIGAGWTEGKYSERQPMLAWISNLHNKEGGQLNQPQEDFSRGERFLEKGEPVLLHAAGIQPRAEDWIQLSANVIHQTEQSDDPEPIGLALVEFIRRTASADSRVGSGVMLNNLPRAPGPPGSDVMLIGKRPDREVRTFTYIPEGGFEGLYLGPLVVGSGGVSMSGFQGLGGGFPDSGMGMSYSPPDAPPTQNAAIGQAIRSPRPGRNDPCWCESGKKYKKCHGR